MNDSAPALPPGRRPLATRQRAWARRLAAALARRRVSPNTISVASVLCAGLAGAALLLPGIMTTGPLATGLLFFVAAVGIQLRLLCNLLDGMVAVEGGLGSAVGELYNEVPDRIADSLILIAAGYAAVLLAPSGAAPASVSTVVLAHGVEVGFAAALIALMTAYLRALGGSVGVPGCFHGPMAKPHRMAVLTAACLVAAGCAFAGAPLLAAWLLWAALALITVGSVVTCVRRLRAIAMALRARGRDGTAAP